MEDGKTTDGWKRSRGVVTRTASALRDGGRVLTAAEDPPHVIKR